ncbi:T9SS type A sorting domain-containing protein [Pseudoflavitalea sp. G-6-1-2]|uniref:CARDB domain-containing protein n=1 Tax=Pseudoflavitalea sp. G-6-1-2 TaxID=2728841 RepID=UPI00146C42CB|nr:CARDB domain-containing protein [Pseudoflavitalea sp. G-6-1-2]NML23213.1 T9SS type A sorting domain-containing protein [Pseudoflavitalea sp. G-6-1-2]
MKNPVFASVSAALMLCVLVCTATAQPLNVLAATSFSNNRTVATGLLLHDIEVEWVHATHGTQNKLWNTEQTLSAKIRNAGTQVQNNIPVSLSITGGNTQSDSKAIPSLAPGQTTTVTFILPVQDQGTQTIKVSVPIDENESNNSKSITQHISCDRISYAVNDNINMAVGSGSGPGIVAVAFPVPEVPIQVNGVTVKLSNDASSIGKSITSVLFDHSGNIFTQSDPLVIQAAMLGTEIEIPFTAPATFVPGDNLFLSGISINASGHSPLASANATVVDPALVYTSDINAGNQQQRTDLGIPAIGLMMTMRSDFSSTADANMMAGTPVMFFASSEFDSYTFYVNNTGKQHDASPYFTYFPNNGDNVTVAVEKNGCIITVPAPLTMTVRSIAPSASNVLYVKKDHPSPGDGSSWGNALNELADALRWAKAREADWTTANPLKIYVAAGEYKPLYHAPDEYFGMDGGPNNAFRMVKNVQIYGGFEGTEGSHTNRNLGIPANETILNGDHSNDDMISGNAGTLTISNNMENALHVVISSGDAGNALLDGFTITGGGGTMNAGEFEMIGGNPVWVKNGGGIYITGSSPKLSNLIITGNSASLNGAGMYIDGSTASITNVLFTRNYSKASGGAIFAAQDGNPIFTNVTIANNRAVSSGGALSIASASPEIRNTIIYGNSSTLANSSGTFRIKYSYVEGAAADIPNNNPSGTLTPLFTDAANGDYSLTPQSPLLNIGNNQYFQAGQTPDLSDITHDLASNLRIRDGIIDLGVYETRPSLALLQHPGNVDACKDDNVNFDVIATANVPITYQWQRSTDGNVWEDIANAKQSGYSLKALSKLLLRCVVSAGASSVTSSPAILSIREVPVPAFNMADQVCLENTELKLVALPSGGVFSGNGVTEDTWSLKTLLPGAQTISYTYTAANGCIGSTAKTFILQYCGQPGPIKSFQLGPNPTAGEVKVKLLLGEDLSPFSSYIITDVHGKELQKRHFTFLKGWTEFSIDLSHYQNGVYFLSIYNAGKKPIITKKIVKR